MTTDSHADIHVLSGAYATDALDDLERAAFERHLTHCVACRDEVDGLRETASLLAAVTPVTPPAALRDRVLAMTDTVRPLPPVIAPPTESTQPTQPTQPTQVTQPAERSSTRRRPVLLAAAAAVLIALGAVGATVWHPWDEPARQPGVTATDARTYEADLSGGGHLRLVVSRERNEAVVTASGLPALPAGRTYQMWLSHDGVMTSAGVMAGDAADVVLAGDAATAEAAAISVEPAGGSVEPTTEPLAIIALPGS